MFLLLLLLSCQAEVDSSAYFLNDWRKVDEGLGILQGQDEVEDCYILTENGSAYSSDEDYYDPVYQGDYCIDSDNYINYDSYKLLIESEAPDKSSGEHCWNIVIKSGLLSLSGTACECYPESYPESYRESASIDDLARPLECKE